MKRRLKEQTGSTLITTVVAITFILLLATIMLAVSSVSLQTKNIEYSAKKNFYEDEKFLTEIYNGIGQETSICFENAYANVLNRTTVNDFAIIKTQQEAYQEFAKQFIAGMEAAYPTDIAEKENIMKRLNKYGSEHTGTDSPVRVIALGGTEVLREDEADSTSMVTGFLFRNLTVTYTKDDFETAVTTDIKIDIPYVTFFDKPDYLPDYALVANQGIYYDGAGGTRTIKGNVYGGTTDTAGDNKYCEKDVYGGINIYNGTMEIAGKYVVSKGDVNVRQGTFKMDNGDVNNTNLWAESIRTTEEKKYDIAEHAEIAVTGNTYAANDLELNSYNSEVSLAGTYYGYNNGVYETQETKTLGEIPEKRAHTQSSSVLINERDAKLDLSGLDTLMISGLAYLNLEKNTIGAQAGGLEQKTGESLALFTNQFLYLVPAEFLSVTNPVMASEAPGLDENSTVLLEGAADTWFASGWLVEDHPVNIRRVTTAEGVVQYYFYLNFKNDDYAKQYADGILQVTQELADSAEEGTEKMRYVWQLQEKKKLQERAGKSMVQAITIGTGSGVTVYGLGAITTLDETTKQLGSAKIPAESNGADYAMMIGSPLTKRYQNLCATLDPKEMFSLISLSVPDAEAAAGRELPLEKYVDVGLLKTNSPSEANRVSYDCGGESILVNGDVTLSTSVNGIVISTGSVTVKSGVHINGMILAGEKIYIEGGGTITADRALVQTMLSEERKAEEGKAASEAYNPNYASCYLYLYKTAKTGVNEAQKLDIGTDYRNYISYQNWRKGGN